VRFYGRYTLSRDKRFWVIDCEPQAALRLKRVFERVSKNPGTILLAVTPENAKEFEWFLQRYPMEPSLHADVVLREKRAEWDTVMATIESIRAADYVPKPVTLALPPRDYQTLPAEMALALGKYAGVLCGDAVGLGKTVEAICLFAREEARPAVVVSMAGKLPFQWRDEINRFAPSLSVHIIGTSTPYKAGVPEDLQRDLINGKPMPDVVIITYAKLYGWADVLGPKIKSVIFDEAQEFRTGPNTAKFKGGEKLAQAATYRLGLTATPVYNLGFEMFNVMSVIAPGNLGTAEEFGREWGGGEVRDPVALGAYLRERGVFLRRTREDVGRELPPVIPINQWVDVDRKPLDAVADRAAELARFLLAGEGQRGDAMRASEELSWKLRCATGLAKAPFVADYVRMLVEGGEPVLLYGWHHDVYDVWAKLLADLDPVFYHGKMTDKQKRESIDAFIRGDSDILVQSLRSGAGVDGLQKRSKYVVFGELDWSPAMHKQCIGRLDRDGQISSEGVTAIFCTSDEGSDPAIIDALGLKENQLTGIIDGFVDEKATGMQGRDMDRGKELARRFLRDRGLEVPLVAPTPKFDFTAGMETSVA